MPSKYYPSFFQPGSTLRLEVKNLTSEVNKSVPDIDIADQQLSDGQNVIGTTTTGLRKRDGVNIAGNYLGSTTGVLGGWSFKSIAGVQEELIVYNTNVYRLVTNIWTALTSVTMTTNKPADAVFFSFTNKFYIVNQTDNVVKYTAGATSGDQTDSAFKKGKYIESFFNRILVANVTGAENRVWYTDNQLDTFSANNFFEVEGTITGLQKFQGMLLIFTTRKVYVLQGFTFDGTSSYASSLRELPIQFGAIIDRTISIVDNNVYFLGTDPQRKAGIYKTDGYSVTNLSESRISTIMDNLAEAQLGNACAIDDGYSYRVYLPELAKVTNTLGIVWDSLNNYFTSPERRWEEGVADFVCMWTVESNGHILVRGGDGTTGQVYTVHANDDGFDVLPEEHQHIYTTDIAVDANPAKRYGQSFKLSGYNSTQTINTFQITVPIKKNTGTTADLQMVLRSGSRTGTIVATSTTVSAFTDTTYVHKDFVFSALSLPGNTTYYSEIKHVTEGAGTSQYFVGSNAAGGYASGNAATYVSGTWTESAGTDMAFRVYLGSVIDMFFASKAWPLAGHGFEYKGRKYMVELSSPAPVALEVGFSKGEYASFVTSNVQFTSITGASTWGGGDVWGGDAVWGGSDQRLYSWQSIENFQGRTFKFQIRNRLPNQQFTFYVLVLAYNTKKRQQ